MHDEHTPTARKRLLIVLPTELDRAIANYRDRQRIISQSEAMRRLLAAGLATEQTPNRTENLK
jgi:hypothetical protein